MRRIRIGSARLSIPESWDRWRFRRYLYAVREGRVCWRTKGRQWIHVVDSQVEA